MGIIIKKINCNIELFFNFTFKEPKIFEADITIIKRTINTVIIQFSSYLNVNLFLFWLCNFYMG